VRKDIINGSVVPVDIIFPSQATKVWLFVELNKQKIAAMADFLVAENNGHFSTRIRMAKSGYIMVVLDDGTGNFKAAKVKADVLIGSAFKVNKITCDRDACFSVLDAKALAIKASEGSFKMLFKDNAVVAEDRIKEPLINPRFLQ